ncbi:YoaK family protein [Mucilaginibacter sp. KACC 22063]|uniref:YoaK family protein n=1 Tax=Mucilaginibacter sp. KACC 22063 TaxID=3025666 RepID=UPI00236625FB|nr:YoaK family protein [Mucilaginibacter sp. KACC 22063]WDF56384.1 YoaK family protein [Mucilaginibacter sp. KACC 22063]
MLRHTGAKRSFSHNLRLAILLCLNAGFINAAGFIAFSVLTTNVTGHAALLAVNLAEMNFRAARMVALWLVLFLSGAFASSWYIGRTGRDKPFAYTVPILVIITIVFLIALFGSYYRHTLQETEYFAGSLLFAMGMQNALVSVISGAVVRTTHLTGMFTDLGIDLSAAALQRRNLPVNLKRRIGLKIAIIASFLLGGMAGGIAFLHFRFHSLFVPVALLFIALTYDYLRIRVKRAIIHRQHKEH